MFLDFLYNYNLTKDQKYVAIELDKFIYNSLDFLIIQGSAGTGKTFLISQFVKYLHRKNLNFMILAPTGRAAKIIYMKSNFKAKTIHSEIYSLFHKEINLNNDEIKIYFKLKDTIYNNTIFILDESSMISDTHQLDDNLIFGSGKILSDLINYIKMGKSNKIIFLGDEYQLPPINSRYSPALNIEYIEKNFNIKGEKLFLNEVIRQKSESYILKNANKIKENINNNTFINLKLEYNNNFIKTDLFTNKYNYKELGKDIIITSTNEKAIEYNLKIRNKLGFKNKIEIGDILLNTKNTYFNEKTIFNGEFFKVIDILNHEKKDAFVGKNEHIILDFYDLALKNVFSDEIIKFKIISNSLFSKNTDIDINLKKAIYSFCINNLSQETKLPLDFIIRIMENDPYFNALHVKYGYAITAHKAQGGEWDKVFIDPYYYNSPKTKEYYQWLYTTITRAKKCVYIKELPIRTFPYNKLKLKNDFYIKKNINISYNLNFSNSHLKELYLAFRDIISDKYFEIIGVEHFKYQEIYYIKKNNEYLKVQLYYNKNFEPTRLKVMESTDEKTAFEFLNIFDLEKQNNMEELQKNDIEKNNYIENEKCIKIYIDGSYDHNIRKFGAGFVVLKDTIEKYWKGYIKEEYIKHRNVAGEIFAALLAFEYAKNENLKCIEINYDYEGIEKWALGLWKTNADLTKIYKEKYNYYCNFFKIRFKKIKSHSGEKYNEISDELAKKAVYEENYNVKYDIDI
ncbi:AAA family ATPase [Marinitoga sp. 38H-ov]|uniref:AAA family ATPase n=1 Tax=Marinitoga sp. 38H-ov TaxID=1755814 RepID=UPI0016941D66|nr:AAA family ATPase [Marinitoga sp. 38H-ov]KAF2956930.1 hypothetical protein AS160_02790 [Marinitoga sp. 38H-ov]